MWLEFVDDGVQLLGFPVVAPFAILARVRKVEPEEVDFAVLRAQLQHLVAHVLGVFAHVTHRVLGTFGGVVAHGVDFVHSELGVVPVNQRVVKTHLDALGTERIHRGTNQVFAVRRVGHTVVGVLCRPQTKAFVVLGGDDEILHAGLFGTARPLFGVKEIGVEVVKELLVVGITYLLVVADPLVARRQGVQPPVDEHAEAVVRKPRRVWLGETGRHWRFLSSTVYRNTDGDTASIRQNIYGCVAYAYSCSGEK